MGLFKSEKVMKAKGVKPYDLDLYFNVSQPVDVYGEYITIKDSPVYNPPPTPPGKYVKKPPVVEAMQLSRKHEEIISLFHWIDPAGMKGASREDALYYSGRAQSNGGVYIHDRSSGEEITFFLRIGDYLVKYPDGSFKGFTSAEFHLNYSPATEV